jgi:hypothetical protein
VRGTITDPLDAVVPGAKVTLQNEQLNKVVDTNNAGIYEADLPLGSYTMMVQMRGFRLYRRPLFRVTTAPSNIILNATLLVGDPCGDMIVVNSSGEPATNEQYIADGSSIFLFRRKMECRSNCPYGTRIALLLGMISLMLARGLAFIRVPYSWLITFFHYGRTRSFTLRRNER